MLLGGKKLAVAALLGLTLCLACSATRTPSRVAPPEANPVVPGGSASGAPEPAPAPDLSTRCDSGEAQACFLRGEELILEGDVAHGRRFFERACEARAGDGCAGLALLFADSSEPADEQRQVEFFRKGCELDSSRACTGLGTLHLEGRLVERDAPRALALYRRACAASAPAACYLLGRHELSGAALPDHRPDLEAGHRHLERACSLGLKRACEPAE